MSFNTIRENVIFAKISEFTVNTASESLKQENSFSILVFEHLKFPAQLN